MELIDVQKALSNISSSLEGILNKTKDQEELSIKLDNLPCHPQTLDKNSINCITKIGVYKVVDADNKYILIHNTFSENDDIIYIQYRFSSKTIESRIGRLVSKNPKFTPKWDEWTQMGGVSDEVIELINKSIKNISDVVNDINKSLTETNEKLNKRLKTKIEETTSRIDIDPSNYYIVRASSNSLTFNLKACDYINDIYEFEVFTGDYDSTSVAFNKEIKWANNNTPELTRNARYQFSIQNDLGVWVRFE